MVAVKDVSAGAPVGAQAPTESREIPECDVHDPSIGARFRESGLLVDESGACRGVWRAQFESS